MTRRREDRLLLVDDEPNVLEGLKRQLRRRFDVNTAPDGQSALLMMEQEGPFGIVMSDMQMPAMNGAVFLGHVRERHPDTVRLLLTGKADIESAIAAVNRCQIFRFLCKPCPGDELLSTLDAAREQFRLVTAERELLDQTLRGTVKALTEILALANPEAFGRATRIKRTVSQIADRMGLGERWALEVAAMFSQVGYITLPPQTVARIYRGEPLTEDEQHMADRQSRVAIELLGNIPRMDIVRGILARQHREYEAFPSPKADGDEAIAVGAQLLRIATDFDALDTQGTSGRLAIDTLAGRQGCYNPAMLSELATIEASDAEHQVVLEIRLREVRPGMVFAEDVVTADGVLLVSRGHEATKHLVSRILNYWGDVTVKEPIRVTVPTAPTTAGPRVAAASS